MYIEYFGLQEEPFDLTPDPKYIYLSDVHKEALARMQFGVEMRKGLLLLTGEVGSGKTTLIQTLTRNRKKDQQIALIVHPKITGQRLIQTVCREFGIDLDFKELARADILNILYEFILKKSFNDRNFGIIIDDAHELNAEQLEDILLLCKLETNTRQLLQIILVGLPMLLDQLKKKEMLPLLQRVQIKYHLKAFSYSDTQDYILHRLAQAGHPKQDIFKAEAIQRIFQLSGGIPRIINVLASNAFLYAYLKGLKKVDAEVINLSSDESLQQEVAHLEEEKMPQVMEKFPPHIREPAKKVRKKRRWIRVLLLGIGLIAGIIILNIMAQYLISYFDLF